MSMLYASEGKIYCKDYTEIYIPVEYFNDEIAINRGSSIETFGVLYIRTFRAGKEDPIQLLNIPVTINLMVYETRQDTIKIHNRVMDVIVLQYLKDAYVLHQTLPKGREIAGEFLQHVLGGQLPKVLDYTRIIDIWWRNLEISGISYKVPSKIYEMIVASIYRDMYNTKRRFGQYYGKEANPDPYAYKANNVRNVTKDLSTFSGMIFEDIGNMITNGVNNSAENIEEPVSPLEKIIHYVN